jgi:hypothetical protein
MNLQQTISKMLGLEIPLEQAKNIANEQFGTLCQYLRELDAKVNPKKETRVYLIDLNEVELDEGYRKLTDEEFMKVSESQGTVYSLAGFQQNFNNDMVNQNNSVIRFIEV